MQPLDILSFTFLNRKINSAVFTNQSHLNEIIVFVLGERLILGPSEEFGVRANLSDYILTVLDPLDVHASETIIDELEKQIDLVSCDPTYQALYLSGECFLKYEYTQFRRTCKLMLYCDPHEFTSTPSL